MNVVIADDQAAALEMLTGVLNETCACRVLATACDGEEAVAAVALHHPDVVILDIAMPNVNGIEAARQVKSEFPETKILFVTNQTGAAYVQVAFQAGASGFVHKALLYEDLAKALEKIAAGERFLSTGLTC